MANLTETLIDSKFFVTPEQIGAMRTDNGIIIFSIGDEAQRHIVRVPQTTTRTLELQAAARRQRRVARDHSRRRDQAKEELSVWYRSVEVDVPENSELFGTSRPPAAAEAAASTGAEGTERPSGGGAHAGPSDATAETRVAADGAAAPATAAATAAIPAGAVAPEPSAAAAALPVDCCGDNETSECAICLDSLPGPLAVVFAPRCGHAFHSECLLRVLAFQTYTCPQCRASLIPLELDHLTPLLTAPAPCDGTNALAMQPGGSSTLDQDAVLEMIASAQAAAGQDPFATREQRSTTFGQLIREQTWMRRTCTRLSLVVVIGLMVLVVFLLVGSSVQYS